MSEHLPPPPMDLQPLVALLGSREAVLKLIEARGGRELYLPHGADRSELTEILGAEVVERIARQCGGDRMRVPLGREWRIQILRARGLSYGQIAGQLGITESGVYRALKRSGLAGNVGDIPATTRQLDLFG